MIIIEYNDYWSKTDFNKSKIKKDIEEGKRLWTPLYFTIKSIRKLMCFSRGSMSRFRSNFKNGLYCYARIC